MPKFKSALWRLTADIIQQWDPYGLLAGGAPADEWDGEISAIAAALGGIHSAAEAAAIVARVFADRLGDDTFTPASCAAVGVRLFARLAGSDPTDQSA